MSVQKVSSKTLGGDEAGSDLVRERPILFSGPMVRAILDGRKSQARRVVTDSNSVGNFKASELDLNDEAWVDGFAESHSQYLHSWLGAAAREQTGTGVHDVMERLYCRYQVGDRLWVRETFFDHGDDNGRITRLDERVEYRATEWDRKGDGDGGGWSPSIHMPRWASRLSLEITEVRVERLQEITAQDCIAEGIPSRGMDRDGPNIASALMYIADFTDLWNGINESRGYGWDANPWVWAISFRVASDNLSKRSTTQANS